MTSTDTEPIPGDPAHVSTVVEHLDGLATSTDRAGHAFRAIDDGGWTGEAAERWRGYIDTCPPQWLAAADAFEGAAEALATYGRRLAAAQQQAAEAVRALERAEAQRESARQQHDALTARHRAQQAAGADPGPPPPWRDPSAHDRAEAQAQLDRAHGSANAAGETAAQVIRRAAEAAPDEPGVMTKIRHNLSSVTEGLGNWLGEAGKGAGETALGAIRNVRLFNPMDPRMWTHPGERVEGASTMAAGAVSAVTHPVDTATAAASEVTRSWQESPARVIGGVAASLVPAGAAGRAASTGTRVTRMAGELDTPPAPRGSGNSMGTGRGLERPDSGVHPGSGHDSPGHGPDDRTARSDWDNGNPDYSDDRDYRTGDGAHEAYRERYPITEHDHRWLGDVRAQNPEFGRVPDENLLAVRRYTGIEHQDWNEALRSGEPGAMAKHDAAARNLSSALNHLPDHQGLVWRGIDVPQDQVDSLLSRYEPGQVVQERAFTSADQHRPMSGNVEFAINSRHGKDIESLQEPGSSFREVLFNSGENFRVVGRQDLGDGRHRIVLDDQGR